MRRSADIERLAAICRAEGAPLIEDCAHALHARLGRRLAGRFAPVSVYSLYKSLPTLEGGALKLDAQLYRDWTGREFMPPDRPQKNGSTWSLFLKNFGKRMAGHRLTGLYRRARYGAEPPDPTVDPLYDPDPEYRSHRCRRISSPTFRSPKPRSHPPQTYRPPRRSRASGIHPFRPPPEVLPCFFPIPRRPRARPLPSRIETYIRCEWPTRHPYDFPEVATLRHEILGLPVHQNLTPEDIERIAATIKQADGT